MNLIGPKRKLKIIVGENEIVYQRPLYEAIVFAAKKYTLSGATVTKGIMAYGADNLNQNSKAFNLSDQLPIIIEMVDCKERIDDFAEIILKLMDKANSSGIIFKEDVDVIRYGKPQQEENATPKHSH